MKVNRALMTLPFGALMIISLLFLAVPVYAGAPLDLVRQGIEEIRSVFQNKQLMQPANAEKRNAQLRGIVEMRFDFEEMARRSLGRHWKERTPEEQKEFVKLYTRLLEDTYLRLVDRYQAEIQEHTTDRVIYVEERIDGNYARVRTMIQARQEKEVPVEYRLINKGGQWKVYDVIATGVSMIGNYRSQFNQILSSGTYGDLLKRVREKIEKPETEGKWPG
jgi:phospholipid transport system substrate-binding protein